MLLISHSSDKGGFTLETTMETAISLRPIGIVKSPFQVNTPPEEIRAQPVQIVIAPELVEGLLGLEAGQDILVLFHLNQINPAEIALQLHPRHDPANPLRGVFATRTQFRPNRLGASVARLEQIEANTLTVSGLDALDETPVLDIKPYAPVFDADSRSQQFEVRLVSSLQEARQAIDVIDAEIIRLLGRRAGFVHQVVDYKHSLEEIRAPQRYAEVMRRRRELAQEAGLNPDVIEEIYKLLVENFIKEEMEILRQREAATAC
jgi:tRNA-Thr(GGU) m(6)t(6)A37 methyltransferase TsaA